MIFYIVPRLWCLAKEYNCLFCKASTALLKLDIDDIGQRLAVSIKSDCPASLKAIYECWNLELLVIKVVSYIIFILAYKTCPSD